MHEHPERRELISYAVLDVVYDTALVGLAVAAERQGRLSERPAAADVVLLGLAVHEVSRLVVTERVTAPLRAPFVERQGHGETPAGKGLRHAIGELVTCPYCTGPWVGLALAAGFVWAPRPVRFVSGLFAALAISDFLHGARAVLRRAGKKTHPCREVH